MEYVVGGFVSIFVNNLFYDILWELLYTYYVIISAFVVLLLINREKKLKWLLELRALGTYIFNCE